jgi:4-amino-4-deoxy-L-arabinose transferase-like glycosyltransferase
MSDPTPMAGPPPTAPASAELIPWWGSKVWRVAEPLSVVALFTFLLEKTWLRWSDPLIDFPRSLYAAWRLSAGDLLYERVFSPYGPLPHLVEAAAFRLFGVGLDTIVWINIVVTVVVLLLWRGIFGALGGRLMVWLASVVFLADFAFSHYGTNANYNFITPYASQATYGLAGLLLLLWALLRHGQSERPGWLVAAGLGLGVAYLDKPEPLLAALAVLGIYLLARTMACARSRTPQHDEGGAARWLLRAVGWLAGGFFCAWLPVFIFFLSKGGLVYAFAAADFVPRTMVGASFLSTVKSSPLVLEMFGFDQPWQNFLFELRQGGWFALLCGAMVLVSRDWTRQKIYGEAWWALLALMLVLGGACIGLARLGEDLGAEFVFPVCLVAGFYVGASLRQVWRGRPSRDLGLALVGVAAVIMLARMILRARLLHYGFFMMPLAVLFWVQLMVVEAARPVVGAVRRNWLLPTVFSALALLTAVTLLRTSLDNYARKNYPVGVGRDRFYTFQPKDYTGGEFLNTMISAFHEKTPAAQSLAAFPEGIAVNYHCRVPTPLAELEFHPVALSFAGPGRVVEELQAHPPDAVFLYYRDLSEYGAKYFGADEASGRDIVLWLREHYVPVFQIGPTQNTVTGNDIDLMVPIAPAVAPTSGVK